MVYFGLVRPDKGLEEFLEVARAEGGEGFCVVGALVEKDRAYYEEVRRGAAAGVEWVMDGSLEDAAERLAGAGAALLPFPDGATLKRGSLLAALGNGTPVVTRVSRETAAGLVEVVLPAEGVREACGCLRRLREDAEFAAELGERGRAFAGRFSWERIAALHEDLYDEELIKVTGRTA